MLMNAFVSRCFNDLAVSEDELTRLHENDKLIAELGKEWSIVASEPKVHCHVAYRVEGKREISINLRPDMVGVSARVRNLEKDSALPLAKFEEMKNFFATKLKSIGIKIEDIVPQTKRMTETGNTPSATVAILGSNKLGFAEMVKKLDEIQKENFDDRVCYNVTIFYFDWTGNAQNLYTEKLWSILMKKGFDEQSDKRYDGSISLESDDKDNQIGTHFYKETVTICELKFDKLQSRYKLCCELLDEVFRA